jgi:flagellar basal body-associated protein FliL
MRAKVLVPLLVLTTVGAVGGLLHAARDATGAPTSPLNLDKAQLPPSQADDMPGVEAAIPLGVVARVQTENGDRYVKMNFELRLLHAKDRDAVMQRLPQMRDAMIYHFLDCKLEDLTGSAGLERTKQGVLRRLQKVIPQPLHSLYITDFVVAM